MESGHSSHERFLRAIHKAVYQIDRAADRMLADSMGGTFAQFMTLMSVAQCPGLTQSDIARFLDLTPAAVSRQMDVLIKAGYISREQDPASRRSYNVTLTDAGHARFAAMHTLLLESFAKLPVESAQLERASAVIEEVIEAMSRKDESASLRE